VDPADEPEQVARDTLLTRADVAARLGVSTSTVRRYEGDLLHPRKGADGVNRFDAQEVGALAMTLLGQKPPKPKPKDARTAEKPRGPARTPGDIAAEVFERLEQRQSLAEIVVGVRVTPELVRDLHREWQRGLIEGELERDTPVLPVGDHRMKRERNVKQPQLAGMLAGLALGTSTRISVARCLGIDYVNGGDEVRRLSELGGFVVQGPFAVDELLSRYGKGEYRITAYAFAPPGLLWEVICSIEGTAGQAG
jgi:AcrR family transcriptional regulator